MANEIIRREFLNKVTTAITSARNVSLLDHAGVKGKAREVFVKNLLSPILPPNVITGSGKIIDSKGNQSAETDVIIYSKQILPPLLFESNFGMYPVEACIYAIEVKSKLTADEVRTSIDKFRRLWNLHYLPPVLDEQYRPIGGIVPPVITMLFAFDTDLSLNGKGELERYRELDELADTNPTIRVICVVGKGYWWFKQNEPIQKWIKHRPTDDYEEVVELIGGIANTIPNAVLAKGKPRFGEYIIKQREFDKL